VVFVPASSHFTREIRLNQAEELGHHRPMRALENRSIEFPASNRAAVHSKVPGELPLAPAHQSALLPKPLRNRLACWQRVVAEKRDDAVQCRHFRGLEFAPFPVDDGKLGDFQDACYGFLGKFE
jgi:hypothetical protein